MERSSVTALALVTGATPLRGESALFEEMLGGWRRQQLSRRLGASLIGGRERTVRRFQAFTGDWPWGWRAEDLERWVAASSWAHSTVRAYQGAVAAFCAYVTDPRYGWVAECEQRVGARPSQICHEDNMVAHVADYEGRPARRPLTRAECQALFDAADDRAQRLAASGRKGWLTAFRDATLLKVTYGWGLRCREVTMLDLTDFSANPAAPQLGGLGVCHVRFGKAMRGSAPRRRAVASVMPWAVEALEEYLVEVRPRFDGADPVAVWPTERGARISTRSVDDRFALYRAAAGLPVELSVHCLRHSYVSHLIEDGVDPLFVQQQVGHSWASTTAIYTSIGADAKNQMLRSALARAFGADTAGG
ncbi:tyrosine-type recombinase/integrase [Intrasporangium chromatireducens]|uniref:tyrosine-type recombinase/integrase n=1 Tax=Intrasporangium chromatireducens TaxID=1386088 RepID=UPI000553CAD4|nr:tyrosine-type recombinase/integrase [Intrasporangium chromatireducens]